MTKVEFLRELSRTLDNIPEDEKNDIIFDYEEHFTIGVEAGRTEEEIAKSLGDPRILSKQINLNYMIDKAEKTSTASNVFRAVLASVGLGFFNLVFVLGPFLGFVGVLIGVWVAAIALTFSGVALFLVASFRPVLPYMINLPAGFLVNIFTSIGLTSLGLLAIIGCYYLTMSFYKLTVKYLKMNLKIINNYNK